MRKCPFSVGDFVRFTPSERTRGLYQNVDRFGIKVGQEGEIKDIRDGGYLYFENRDGGWPWNEFTLVRKARAK
jgi:hypothetical protein